MTITLSKCSLQMLTCIGGAEYQDDYHNICGIAAHLRKRENRLSLWTRDASDELSQVFCVPECLSHQPNVLNEVFAVLISKAAQH